MSERSSLRMRAVRSTSRSSASRQTHGPAIRSSAPATAPGASSVEDVPPPESSSTAPNAASAMPAVGQRRVGAEAAALPPGECEPARDQRDARRPTRSERPSAPRSAAARDEREQRGDPDVLSLAPTPRERGRGGSRPRRPAPGARRRAGRGSGRPQGSARCPRRPPRSPARRSSGRTCAATCGLIVRRARREPTPRRRARRARGTRSPVSVKSTSDVAAVVDGAVGASTSPSLGVCACTRSATSGGDDHLAGRRRRRSSRRASRPQGAALG